MVHRREEEDWVEVWERLVVGGGLAALSLSALCLGGLFLVFLFLFL